MIGRERMRVALCAWEIGRTHSGLGAKVGGLGVVLEELPPQLVAAAARQGVSLEVEVLSPCFGHYDRRRLRELPGRVPVNLAGHTFEFTVYEHLFFDPVQFPDGIRQVPFRMVYFWDDWQLHWTRAQHIYPDDPWMGLKLYSAVSQAMAGYLRTGGFDTIHLHDYHVGLIPFYLDDETLSQVPIHLTVHNASYQGITPVAGSGEAALEVIHLPGHLYSKYFDFFQNINLMRGAILRVHETGGRLTTVSGDLEGTWGYAAELREDHPTLLRKAAAQKGAPPGEVFVPNRHLDLFEKIPVCGITNGMSDANRPENMPELKASVLRALQAQRGPEHPIFRDPVVQEQMLARDHTFDADHLETKLELRRLLHREVFGHEIWGYPILFTSVGRLVEQKNLGLVADIIDRTLVFEPQARFIVLASPVAGDPYGRRIEERFFDLMRRNPGRVWFGASFNPLLSKLILAGGDFCLVPSRFEPCGLVDYEASLLGNIVVGRRTGGLAKVAHCAYLYDWLDVSDPAGEAGAFFARITEAIRVFRETHPRHLKLMRRAMSIDASWKASADTYLRLYRYGFLAKKWQRARQSLLRQFCDSLGEERALFAEFFAPARGEYSDRLDSELWSLVR
jgi:glycogen synthase